MFIVYLLSRVTRKTRPLYLTWLNSPRAKSTTSLIQSRRFIARPDIWARGSDIIAITAVTRTVVPKGRKERRVFLSFQLLFVRIQTYRGVPSRPERVI